MCQWNKYFIQIAVWDLLCIRQKSAFDWYLIFDCNYITVYELLTAGFKDIMKAKK